MPAGILIDHKNRLLFEKRVIRCSLLALDGMDTCCWTGTVADWDQESRRRKKLAVLCHSVTLKSILVPMHLVTDRREFSSYSYYPTVLAAAQAPETVVVVATASYAELSH